MKKTGRQKSRVRVPLTLYLFMSPVDDYEVKGQPRENVREL